MLALRSPDLLVAAEVARGFLPPPRAFFGGGSMTLQEIKAHLAKWEAADLAVSRGKSYTVDGLTYTRQDASAIRDQLEYWRLRLAMVLRHGRAGVTVRPVVSLDHWPAPWVPFCRRWW